MSRYTVTSEDLQYAKEFMLEPGGYCSPGLQRVLNVMRTNTTNGKFVLIVREPGRRWVLGRTSCKRGEPVEVMDNIEFHSLEEAERQVFRLRWQALTGESLEL